MPSPTSRSKRAGGTYKYQPLVDYLAAQSADEVALSFAQMEALVGPLPAAAYQHAWWTGTGAARERVQRWRAAGWEATAVVWRDDERWVTFRWR